MPRLLGSLLLHGKQTDRERSNPPGIWPDVKKPSPWWRQLKNTLVEAEQPAGMPSATPMNYLKQSVSDEATGEPTAPQQR